MSRLENLCFPLDPWSPSTLESVLERRPDTLVLGAFIDGGMAGYAAASFPRSRPARLLSIAVEPGCRNRGIGSDLISCFISRARFRGARKVSLEVRKSSSAVRFYEGKGFRVKRVLPSYYPDGEAGLLMEKPVFPCPQALRAIRVLHELLEGRTPGVGVILGSGLGWLAETEGRGLSIGYDRIPGMGGGSVEGHAGRLALNPSGDTVFLMGRRHHYQGYTGDEVSFLPSVLASMGTDTWILTTSAGAVDPGLRTGDAVVFSDHVNLSGCFPEPPGLSPGREVYPRSLRERALSLGETLEAPVRSGVFCGVSGPGYETPAEVEYLAGSGVSAVSMSTVQEALSLAAQGCGVLGVALVTNQVDQGDSVDHEEVLQARSAVMEKQGKFLPGLVEELSR